MAAGVAYALFSGVVYPNWLEPMLSIDERVTKARAELDEMLEFDAKVQDARTTYRRYLDRMGSFDAKKIDPEVRERLNKLIAEHGLTDLNYSGGSARPTSFGKVGAKRITLTVQATASLEGAIGFLRGVYELPHVMRVGNVSISPSRSARRKKRKNKPSPVSLKVPIELLVLPAHKMVGKRLKDDDLHQPESLVRHEGRNYSLIWERTPFTEYVKIEPLVVSAGEDVEVIARKSSVSLKGTVTGGDGENVITWTTSDGTGEWLDKLSATNTLRVRIRNSEPFSQSFTLTVADGSGNIATDDVEVTIRGKETRVVENTTKPEPEPDRGPKRWNNGNKQKLVMTLISRNGGARHDEVMVHNSVARKTSYYRLGDEFDGGELVFVHPRGAIVRRQDEYFVYPIGAKVSNDVKAKEADDYPTLKRVTAMIRESLGEPAWDAEADAEAEGEGEEPAGESSVVTVADTEMADADAAKPVAADSETGDSEAVEDTDGEAVDDSDGGSKDTEAATGLNVKEAAPTKGPPAAKKQTRRSSDNKRGVRRTSKSKQGGKSRRGSASRRKGTKKN